MRFALVGLTYPYRGGISQYTTSLYKALEKKHEVLLISFSRQYPSLLFPGNTQLDSSREVFQAPAEALLDSINPLTWRRAARRILDFGPDLVIFQWWQPFFGPAYASIIRQLKRRGVRVCFLCHNVYGHERPQFPGAAAIERLFLRRAIEHADGFLVHSEKLVAHLRDLNVSAPVERIYHPVYDFYTTPPSDREPAAGHIPRILFFGKIRDYKGLGVFLMALAFVKKELKFEATIAGEFYADQKRYLGMARDLELSGLLKWESRYIPNEEVPFLFQGADVVVLPYLEATQSGVVPLAYQFDVPAIASDVGGLCEVVLDGKTGYLVPPGNPEALAAKIVQYFRDNRKMEFQTNIRGFKQKLNWEQVVAAIETLAHETGAVQA